MSNSLTLVLFSYGSKLSILQYLSSVEDMEKYCIENVEHNLKIIVFDQDSTSYEGKNVSIKNKPIYDWNETYSPTGKYTFKGLYTKELNDTLLFDKDEGEVIFVCFNNEELDTYSIMEDLETQVYNKRYYYYHDITEEFKERRIIRRWQKEREVETTSEKASKSPKYIEDILDKKYSYELYSGKTIPETISELDKIAIKSRMLLLAESIIFYLNVSFDKKFNIEESSKLQEKNVVYNKDPFFSDEEIHQMVTKSYYFQVEDPLLKGFLLAHPPRVVSEKKSEFGEETSTSINPLEIERDIRWLMFNHGQFRQILLSTIMQVVSTFAGNNGFLYKEDIAQVSTPTKKKKSIKKEKKTVITEKKGAVTSKSMLRPIKIEEEEEQEERPHINIFYNDLEIWKKIIRRIERQLNE